MKFRKACGIAVGVQHQGSCLRGKTLDDMRQQRPAGEQPQAFVAATHSPCETAGQKHADNSIAGRIRVGTIGGTSAGIAHF